MGHIVIQQLNGNKSVIAVALSVFMLSACNPGPQAKTADAIPEVSVMTAKRVSVPVTTELPGRTSAFLTAQVRARVDGIVKKSTFEEGADVKANQVLFQIDAASYRAAVNSAEASLQKAEANLAATTGQSERYKILIAGNAVSKQAYDNAIAAQRQAAADVATAKAALEVAKINLGYTNVVSPINGRSGIAQVTQGAFVQASAATLLTTVQQIDPIYVDLNQSSLAGLKLNRKAADGSVKLNKQDQARVMLTLEDGTPYPTAGTLKFSGTTVDPATGSVVIRAIFPNPDHTLLPGMFVRARIEQGTNDNAIPIPVPAVDHNQQGQATVLIVDADHKVVQRIIQTANMIDGHWIVTAGLNPGEQVIVDGLQKIKPGASVRSIELPDRTNTNPTQANTVNGAHPQPAANAVSKNQEG